MDPQRQGAGIEFAQSVLALALCALPLAPGCAPQEPSPPGTASGGADGAVAEWEPLLLDDLDNWELVGGSPEGAVLEDGVLAFSTAGGGGYLRTVEDFSDFRLRLEFKIARMANSGVFLRGARDGTDPAYSGCEVQILDDFNWEAVTGTQLEPYQFTGGLYGSVAPGEEGASSALLELGEWNHLEIEYRGTHVEVVLNDQLLYSVDTLEVPGKPFAERAPEGFIGLQRHAPAKRGPEPYAWFRNVFVQRL